MRKLVILAAKWRTAVTRLLGGALVAVGDGVYLLGADGLLHRREGSQVLEGALATSLYALGDEVYVGSARGGAFPQGRLSLELRQELIEKVATAGETWLAGVRTVSCYRSA
jgi:hypothetical protein